MSEKKEYYIVDKRTGEVLDDYHPFPEPMNEKGYRFPHNKSGSRLFSDVEFPDGMSPSEIGRMAILSKLMVAKTNMLGYRYRDKIVPYSEREIWELAQLRERQGRAFITKMVNLRVMQRINTNSGVQYYINPAYFMAAGQRLSLDLFLLFRDELEGILPKWVMKEFLSHVREKKFPYDAVEEAEKILDGRQ